MVGNHYSLRQDPERAIQYFRRATELDQSYLPAWTLMGHEYVEIKNSHAAIESYRRAIGMLFVFVVYDDDGIEEIDGRFFWFFCRC